MSQTSVSTYLLQCEQMSGHRCESLAKDIADYLAEHPQATCDARTLRSFRAWRLRQPPTRRRRAPSTVPAPPTSTNNIRRGKFGDDWGPHGGPIANSSQNLDRLEPFDILQKAHVIQLLEIHFENMYRHGLVCTDIGDGCTSAFTKNITDRIQAYQSRCMQLHHNGMLQRHMVDEMVAAFHLLLFVAKTPANNPLRASIMAQLDDKLSTIREFRSTDPGDPGESGTWQL